VVGLISEHLFCVCRGSRRRVHTQMTSKVKGDSVLLMEWVFKYCLLTKVINVGFVIKVWWFVFLSKRFVSFFPNTAMRVLFVVAFFFVTA